MIGFALKWLLDPRVLLGLAIAIAVVAAVVYVEHLKRKVLTLEAQMERERGAWATERANAATITAEWQEKARAADERERDRERMWNDVARTIERDGAATAERLRGTLARANAAGLGLSVRLGAVVADAARAAEASASTADARERQAAAETTRVLADLLGRCHERGRSRAEFADRAAAAGEACQRWVETLERGEEPH